MMRRPILLFLFLYCATAQLFAVTEPNLRAVSKNKTVNSDYTTGFSAQRLYVSGGYGLINGNFIVASAIKESVAKGWDNVSVVKRPTWFLRTEYAISPHWGLGINFASGGVGFNVSLDSLTSQNVQVSGNLSYTTWSALARVNYHIFNSNKLDIFIGTGIGYRGNRVRVTSNDPVKDRWNFPVDLGFVSKVIPNTIGIPTLGADFTAGVRYFPHPAVAFYTEFGIAKSIIQGGVSFAFNTR
jgi:hypothetical protein